MEPQFATLGALIGLALAIALIIRKYNPSVSLIFGAFVGGIVGSLDMPATVAAMSSGAQTMTAAALRILTSGVLAGALIGSGAAESIANKIIDVLGERFAVVSICIATGAICSVGVLIDVAVITAAPIALAIGKRLGFSRSGVLLAMLGGGKAGNIVSANPNTLNVADVFKQDLFQVMLRNVVPAIFALAAAALLASILVKRKNDEIPSRDVMLPGVRRLPSFGASLVGPIAIVAMIALKPLCGIDIDPLIALPVGGAIVALATRNIKNLKDYCQYGLGMTSGVSILLISVGTLSGVIKESALQHDLSSLLAALRLPAYLLAPLSGALLGGATGSTMAGATVAAESFSGALLKAGVPALACAAMINSGATILDSLPQGSFFHASGGVVRMNFRDRLKLVPYEAIVGLVATVVSTAIYVIFGK